MENHPKSKGHLALSTDGTVEWFERGGDVYRAPIGNPIMTDGFRCGRFESSRALFDHFRAVILF